MERLLILLVGLSLAACSQSYTPIVQAAEPEVAEYPMDPEARENYLNAFRLTNLRGEEAAPRINDERGTTPFGVLLKLPREGKVSACSVSHLWSGYLVTNAHCVTGQRTMGIQNYFVVFYNRDGLRVHVPLESIGYLGDASLNDIAVLKIAPEHAQTWDSLEAQNIDNPALAAQVTLWGFDPIELPNGGTVMAFSPKTCLASRVKPEVLGVEPGGHKESVLGKVRLEPDHHIFVDRCSSKLVAGNSGSLITGLNEPKQAFGVYHWAITPTAEAERKFARFNYTGNQRIEEILPNPPPLGLFFGVGSVLRWKLPTAEIQ